MVDLQKGPFKTINDGEDILLPLDYLKRLDDSTNSTGERSLEKSIPGGLFTTPDPDSVSWGNWGRSRMDTFKEAALNSKTVYAFCFVHSANNPATFVVGFGLVLLCLTIQIAIPLAIVISQQPVLMLDPDDKYPRACPMRSGPLVKIFAVALSAYFVTLTLGLCTNKLRGLNFLRNFVNLGTQRRMCLEVGIIAQMIGIIITSFTQYLLFIGNAEQYHVLLLGSLSMQFCLEVDIKILSHQLGAWTISRLKAVSEDRFLALDDGGLGRPDTPMPAKTLTKLNYMDKSERVVLTVFLTLGLFLSASLAVCM